MEKAAPTAAGADPTIAPYIAPGDRRSLAMLSWLEVSHLRSVAALLLLSLVLFLPGFSTLQPMDRDEPRFAQASKQMLETGDYIAIRFQDEARNKKPVGIYWLQAGAVKLGEAIGIPESRTTIGLYRLPSLLGAIAAVLLSYWALLVFGGRRVALIAAALFAATILLTVEARLAKTDALLAACCIAMMGGLARAWIPGSTGLTNETAALPRSVRLIFWGALAISVLVKGPMGLLIVGLPAIALSIWLRSARWLLALKPLTGVLLAVVLVAPWFVAITIETKGAFFAEAVGKDMLGKIGQGQEKHWGPPGAYFLAFFGTAWPLAPFAAISAQTIWRERRNDLVAFALAWVVPAWLLFEIVPTKLPHYVLPLYPAIAFLVARALVNGALAPSQRWGARPAMLLLPLIPVLGLFLLPVAGWGLDRTIPWIAVPGLIVAAAIAIVGWLAYCAGNIWRSTLLAIASAVVFIATVLGVAQPQLAGLRTSPRLADAMHAAAAATGCADMQALTAGYREPSLVFLTRTDLIMADGAAAADWIRSGACRVAFVTAQEDIAFQQKLAGDAVQPTLFTRIKGFNLNGGKRLDIGVWMVGQGAAKRP